MTDATGSLTAPGMGSPFAPATGRLKVTASGLFKGVAVLMRSVDGGNT